MSEEHCVMCGDIIPEGRMVCPICEKKWKRTPIEVFKPAPDEVLEVFTKNTLIECLQNIIKQLED